MGGHKLEKNNVALRGYVIDGLENDGGELSDEGIIGKDEDVITRKRIVSWLDNWSTFSIGEPIDEGDYGVDCKGSRGGNSGCKTDDGISDGFLNVVMMEEAIGKLCGVEKKAVLRWTQGLSSRMELRISAVNNIYRRINGLVR